MKKETIIIYLLVMLSLVNAQENTVKMQGVVQDDFFSAGDSLKLEVLESGQNLGVRAGEPFSLDLPSDTSWTLCATNSASQEKCWPVKYLGRELVFTQTLGGSDSALNVVWQNTDSLSQQVEQSAKVEEVLPDESDSSASDYVEERVNRLSSVVVRLKRRPKRSLGQSTVSAKKIKRMPSLGEADVIRAIQALPGVVASSDFSTKIYVRGGGADQNLFLFDNGVVFSPVHFFGLFSTFLVEGIDKVDFYKGGFEPEYGNRLSSVVDVQSRDGAKDSADAIFARNSVKISTFATQAHTEGRYQDYSWVAAARTTYIKEMLDFLKWTGATDFTLDYRFFDLQGNVLWKPEAEFSEDERDIRVSWYAGEDRLSFDPFLSKWGNVVLPINAHWGINEDWDSWHSFAYSKFYQTFGLAKLFTFDNNLLNIGLKTKFQYSGWENHKVSTGMELQIQDVDFAMQQAGFSMDDGGKSVIISPFVQDVWDLDPWSLKLGARFNYYTSTNHFSAEPRLSARWNFADDQHFDFHLGYYYQYINSILFGDFESINEFYYPAVETDLGSKVPPSHSGLLSLGYNNRKFLGMWDLTTEVYYKTLDDLIVFDVYNQPDSIRTNPDAKLGDLMTRGEGYSYGFEFALRADGDKFGGGFNYAFGDAVLKESGKVVNAKWDKKHSFKGDFYVNWKGKDGIWPHKIEGRYVRSSMQASWSTGLPFTELAGYLPSHLEHQGVVGGPSPTYDANTILPYSGYNDGRYPNYFRFDIKLIDIGREGHWSFAWTIVNVTDTENVFIYSYDTNENPPELLTINQFPFFPMLINYEYFF